jgi:hypothetical protein
MGNAQRDVVFSHIFQFLPTALIPGSEAFAYLVKGVAAPFFHADKPIVSLVIAVAVEVVHEGVEELIVKKFSHVSYVSILYARKKLNASPKYHPMSVCGSSITRLEF